jgi:hypothetical protein
VKRQEARDYAAFRKSGATADQAKRYAKTLARWRELEDLGVVRLRVEPDDDADLSFLDLDHYQDTREGRAAAKHVRDLYERDGAWGTISEYRTDPTDDDAWEQADSCWGHIGYKDPASPFENWYVCDEMAEAIEQYEAATAPAFG